MIVRNSLAGFIHQGYSSFLGLFQNPEFREVQKVALDEIGCTAVDLGIEENPLEVARCWVRRKIMDCTYSDFNQKKLLLSLSAVSAIANFVGICGTDFAVDQAVKRGLIPASFQEGAKLLLAGAVSYCTYSVPAGMGIYAAKRVVCALASPQAPRWNAGHGHRLN